MNLFLSNEEEQAVNGYVSNVSSGYFPVVREVRIRVFTYNGKAYFRTRDMAALLGIKQPFQFVYRCRQRLGSQAVLKGEDTRPFRPEGDGDSVTYIGAGDLLRFLESPGANNPDSYEPGMYEKVVRALREMEGQWQSD